MSNGSSDWRCLDFRPDVIHIQNQCIRIKVEDEYRHLLYQVPERYRVILIRGSQVHSLILDDEMEYYTTGWNKIYVRNFIRYKDRISWIHCRRWILPLDNPLIHRKCIKLS